VSISVNIHPRGFTPLSDPTGANIWVVAECGGGSDAAIFLTSPELCDEFIRAATEAKRLHAALSHAFTRPGQVAPDRPARDACMVCGQPEAAHAGEGEGK
jgi:hypothetical protein